MSKYVAEKSKSFPKARSLEAGQRQVFTVAEGDYLEIKTKASSSVTVQELDKTVGGVGGSSSPFIVGASDTRRAGPYTGEQKVLAYCQSGSADTSIVDGVLATLSPSVVPNQINGPGGVKYLLSGNSRSQLPKTAAKMAKIRAGKTTGANGSDGQLRAALVGDSTTPGAGAGTGSGLLVGARAKSIIAALKAQIIKRGIRCIDDAVMGDQLTYTMLGNAGYSQFDPRLAFTGTAGIFPNGAMKSLGGVYFRLNAVADSMIFTPSEAWDTARIHTVNASVGAASMSIDSGASTTGITGNSRIVTTNIGQTAFASQVITKAKGTQALTIGNVTGNANTGTPVIRGIEMWDSANPAVSLIGLGEYGTRLSVEYDASAFALAFLADLYDLAVIDMTINDMNVGGVAALSAYLTKLDQAVLAAKASGADVAICTPNCVNLPKSTVDMYNAAIINYSLTNGIFLLDVGAEMGDFTVAQTNGLMADSLHPTDVGYQVKSVPLANLLTSI